MFSKWKIHASDSSSVSSRGSKAKAVVEIFDEDDSMILVPPSLSKAKSKTLDKCDSKVSIGSFKKEAAEKESRGDEEDLVIGEQENRSVKTGDDKINMSFTWDSKTADEVSQMHSFELSVDDAPVEASLEITYENFIQFERNRKKTLQKIVEGSDVSEEATCDELEQVLDHAEEDQMDLNDSDSVSSKQSAMSKRSISSKRSVSSKLSKKVGLFGKKDKRSVSGHQDDGSVASKRSDSSKHRIRSTSSKKDKGGDTSQQDNGSVTSKRSVSSKHSIHSIHSIHSASSKKDKGCDASQQDNGSVTSKRSVSSKRSIRSAFRKQDKHNVASEQDIGSVSTKDGSSSKQETAQGQQDNTSVSSKLSKRSSANQERLSPLDKKDSGDLGPSVEQSGTEPNDSKALTKLELEKIEHQVEQIKAAMIKRKKERIRLKETAEQRIKMNIKYLEEALATRKKDEAEIEARFAAHQIKARAWQKPPMPVSPKHASEDLLLPPPNQAGPNLQVREVDKVDDTPWYVKMFSWHKPQSSEDQTMTAPSSAAGGGSDFGSAKCDDDPASIDQTKKAVPHAEAGDLEPAEHTDKTAPVDDDTVAAAWKDLVQAAGDLRFTFTEGGDQSKAKLHQNTSMDSEKTGNSSRFSQFKNYVLKRKKSMLKNFKYAKNELGEFAVDVRESFSGGGDEFDFSTAVQYAKNELGEFAVDVRKSFSGGGGDEFDFSTAVEDSNKKSGGDNSTVATMENAGNDPATAKDSGSKGNSTVATTENAGNDPATAKDSGSKDNSTVATTENAGNDPATAKDSGSKDTTAIDEEEDASQTSDQVGKVVSFDASTVGEEALLTQ